MIPRMHCMYVQVCIQFGAMNSSLMSRESDPQMIHQTIAQKTLMCRHNQEPSYEHRTAKIFFVDKPVHAAHPAEMRLNWLVQSELQMIHKMRTLWDRDMAHEHVCDLETWGSLPHCHKKVDHKVSSRCLNLNGSLSYFSWSHHWLSSFSLSPSLNHCGWTDKHSQQLLESSLEVCQRKSHQEIEIELPRGRALLTIPVKVTNLFVFISSTS